MTVATCLKLWPSEAQLATLAFIMRAIQAIVFTITLHDWPDCEEFSVAILWRQHISSICVDHTCTRTRPWMHISCELIWLVKSPINQVSCIIISIFIE